MARPGQVAEFLAELHTGAGLGAVDVLDGLRRLIGCDIASYRRFDDVGGRPAFFRTSGVDLAVALPLWGRYPELRHGDPLPGLPYDPDDDVRPTTQNTAMRSSDVISDRRFRSCGFYFEMCRPLGSRYLMKLFAQVGTEHVGFVLETHGPDFSDEDVDLLTALAPHFELAHRRLDRASSAGCSLEGLSPRELDVARLVAEGLTNAQIAATLLIAVGTVRKHLDNIYARAAVNSRTSLARLVLQSAPGQ